MEHLGFMLRVELSQSPEIQIAILSSTGSGWSEIVLINRLNRFEDYLASINLQHWEKIILKVLAARCSQQSSERSEEKE